MEIKYIGHSSFRLKGSAGTVITDPYDPAFVGLPFAKTMAEIVTMSHQHEDHNFLEKITGTPNRPEPLVFDAPGEYEAHEISLMAIPTYHDDKKGEERGKNLIFVFHIDGVLVAHLGDLGHELNKETLEEIGPVDVLLVPVGGHFTMSPEMAIKTINEISPSIVIPMHYKVEGMKPTFDSLITVKQFLDKAGFEKVREEDKLKVTKDALPDDTEVVVLKHE